MNISNRPPKESKLMLPLVNRQEEKESMSSIKQKKTDFFLKNSQFWRKKKIAIKLFEVSSKSYYFCYYFTILMKLAQFEKTELKGNFFLLLIFAGKSDN